MADIDRIEPDQGREQAPVGLGDPVTHQIATGRQPLFHPVERREQLCHRFLIGFFRRREAAAIDAVVDMRIDIVIHLFDGVAHLFRPVIVTVAGQPVEGRVEHADDLGGFVGDDLARLFVPQDGHGNAPGRGRVAAGIDLVHEVAAEQVVAAGAMRVMIESPAVFQHQRMHYRHRDMVGQPLQLTEDQRAVRPRAGI